MFRRERLIALLLLLGSSIAWAQNPLAKRPDPFFTGTFKGDGVVVELGEPAARGERTGSLTFEGKSYPLAGTAEGDEFIGKFSANQEEYLVQLQRNKQDDSVKLTTGGSVYTLQKDRPVNPLVRGGGAKPEPQPPQPPPPASAPKGGIGVAFLPTANKELQIAQVLPGGPAAKAGLQPGGILKAVDGRNVEGMTPEQLRGLIGGEPGTIVKLLVVTDTEIMDVMLERADLSKLVPPGGGPAPAPNPAPAPGPQPGNGQQGAVPALPGGGFGQQPVPGMPAGPVQNAAAPAWMKPGARVTFWAGSASVASAGQVLVPDDQGNWVNKAGQKFSVQNNPGAGGAGYQQFTVASVTNDTVVADFKQYLYNPETRLCTTTLATGHAVPLAQGGELWQPPAKLAQMQEMRNESMHVIRGPYTVGNKTFPNAISIATITGNGGTRHTYDLETGLLLSFGSSSVGQGGYTPTGTNTSGWTAGNTMIVQILFHSMRQTSLPWAGQRGAGEILRTRQLQFAGTQTQAVANAGQVQWPVTVRWDISRLDELSFDARTTMHIQYPNTGLPNEPTVTDRGGSLAYLWIDPRVLGSLRQGQVLDEDPVTGMRTSVTGVGNGVVALSEGNQAETGTAAYNTQTGMVQAMGLQTQLGLGTTVVQLQRVR